MGTRTFPKSSAHPSGGKGQQKDATWPDTSKTRYPSGGMRLGNTEKSKCHKDGRGESPVKEASYPQKKRSFPTESTP